jgi:tellurite resistance protein
MTIHQAAARQLLRDLRGVDTALERLEDAVNVALSDLPDPAEYKLLTQIGSALTVIRAVTTDHLTAARQLWPES